MSLCFSALNIRCLICFNNPPLVQSPLFWAILEASMPWSQPHSRFKIYQIWPNFLFCLILNLLFTNTWVIEGSFIHSFTITFFEFFLKATNNLFLPTISFDKQPTTFFNHFVFEWLKNFLIYSIFFWLRVKGYWLVNDQWLFFKQKLENLADQWNICNKWPFDHSIKPVFCWFIKSR